MKAVKFKHQNVIFAENQPEYTPLPALRFDTKEGEVVSCWKLSFKELVMIIFTRRVWLSVMAFGLPIAPCFIAVDRKEVYSHPDDKHSISKRIKSKL